jgi:hypothetical protein
MVYSFVDSLGSMLAPHSACLCLFLFLGLVLSFRSSLLGFVDVAMTSARREKQPGCVSVSHDEEGYRLRSYSFGLVNAILRGTVRW